MFSSQFSHQKSQNLQEKVKLRENFRSEDPITEDVSLDRALTVNTKNNLLNQISSNGSIDAKNVITHQVNIYDFSENVN